MLVLTRKVGEGLIIGDDVRITVVELKGGGVRIGIEAPQEKKIYRLEVYDRICEENKNATQWEMSDLSQLETIIPHKEK